jgi:hypothetical protein
MTSRRRVTAKAVLAFVWLAAATCALAQGYYPSGDGLSWTYSSGETQIMQGPLDLNGQPVMVLTHFFQGAPVTEDYLVYEEDSGVRSVGTASGGRTFTYEPPLVVWPPAPLTAGQTWQSTTEVAGLSLTSSSEVLGLSGVDTSAGRFNAFHIRQVTLTSSGARTALDLFFVPTVGIVRFVSQDGTTVDLIERNFD